MYNYIEMRSHVTSPLFLIRKRIDNALHYLFPSLFIPLYSMVAFTRIPYRRVVERHNVQQTVIRRGLWGLSLASLGLLGYLIFKFSGMESCSSLPHSSLRLQMCC
ncbi:Kynurenine 3-monooxygenase [Geodia barretti]|uniref:Kynurenine 3-monooxygenase n=1 Tax=Geodia barretti TaxID=519541 RepID=A0AA35TBR0_GEOBA|nr:Kynurenine 3-monooxygenase [Geodia barretti]